MKNTLPKSLLKKKKKKKSRQYKYLGKHYCFDRFNLVHRMVRILIWTQEIYFELDIEIDKNSRLSLKDCFRHQR